MGLARETKQRREATFALIDRGADAFFLKRSELLRQVTMGRQTWAGVLKSANFDAKAWGEIERVLIALGCNLAERTNQESKKFWKGVTDVVSHVTDVCDR